MLKVQVLWQWRNPKKKFGSCSKWCMYIIIGKVQRDSSTHSLFFPFGGLWTCEQARVVWNGKYVVSRESPLHNTYINAIIPHASKWWTWQLTMGLVVLCFIIYSSEVDGNFQTRILITNSIGGLCRQKATKWDTSYLYKHSFFYSWTGCGTAN
jgi:hypothetical protein